MNLFSRTKTEPPKPPAEEVRAAAQAAFDKWKTAATAAKAAEKELFAALFDEQTGLKQPSADADEQREATKLRFSLNSAAQEHAIQIRYTLDSKFRTDGNLNLGEDDMAYYWSRVFSGQAR